MSKFTRFILFNIFMYVLYIMIDKVFTKLDFYSNPQLGQDIMVMPTSGDVWLVALNTLLSAVGALYVLRKMPKEM